MMSDVYFVYKVKSLMIDSQYRIAQWNRMVLAVAFYDEQTKSSVVSMFLDDVSDEVHYRRRLLMAHVLVQ